jgi:pyruvate dehydrogenase E1 component beta subunit
MINFAQAFIFGLHKFLSSSKKNMLFGLEVTNEGVGLKEKFTNQVYETPVSELSSTGLCVGLATKGFRPHIVFGRVEFAMLAFDQIFTQAGRWEYSFGGNYNCPITFRIQVGRQWGNGPQHTCNYHSIFAQSYGIDLSIPSTPQEAYDATIRSIKINKPLIILEHRHLALVKQDINFKKKNEDINFKVYGSSKRSKILVVTYADTLIDALKAKKYLRKVGIYITIINFSYFDSSERVNKKAINFAKKFKKIIFFDSAPFNFGILSGIMSIFSLNFKSDFYALSPKNIPAPAATYLLKDYYKNHLDLINFCYKILGFKKKPLKEISFNEAILMPILNFDELL